jgi:dCTP deaminase
MWNFFGRGQREKANGHMPAGGILPRDEYIKAKVINEGLADACCSPASYELRIGSHLSLSDKIRREMEDGDSVQIPGGGILHIGTLEKVELPLDVMGMMYLLSTFARRGCLSWFQGLVDPGYKGHLTVVLHNMTQEPITFQYKERLCHIVFHRLTMPATKAYAGGYQGSLGAAIAPSMTEAPTITPFLGPAFSLLSNPKVVDALMRLAEHKSS